MRKVGFTMACAVALGRYAPAMAQGAGECTSAAYKREHEDRGGCVQPDPENRKQCAKRAVAKRERAVTLCLQNQTANAEADAARASEARATNLRRQLDRQQNAQPRR